MYFGIEHKTSTNINDLSDLNLNKSYINIIMTEELQSSVLINGTRIPVEPHSVIIINSRVKATADNTQINPYYYLYFSENFLFTAESDLRYLEKIIQYNESSSGYIKLQIPDDHLEFSRFCCKQLLVASNNLLNPFMAELAKSIVRQIMIKVYLALFQGEIVFRKKLLNSEEKALWAFYKLLEVNVSKERNVSFYAEKLHLTPRQLGNITKKAFDKTPKEIILDNLIIIAKSIILKSDKSIKEIAWDLGFSDENNFSTIFHKKTGMRPTDLRKK